MRPQGESQFASQSFILFGWAVIALCMANIADGIAIDPLAVFLFSSGMALLGSHMQSFLAFASFSIVTVLTAVLVSGYQGISVSSEQFFNPYFGAADLLVLMMMWGAPLVAWITRRIDNGLIHSFKLFISRVLQVEFPKLSIPQISISSFSATLNEVWSDQFFYCIDYRRGPPLITV